ncbi:MAG TPA: phage tail tape measure protein, partial [Bacteroidia bacterium]|nr:phage tail tape measure protein [Bacteroidia bacterium]
LNTEEANRKLKELKLSAVDLKEKLDQMAKGSPERKEAQRQLRDIQKEIKGVQNALNKRVDIIINGNVAGASIRDLQEASRKLWNEIRKLAPETQEFIDKSKRLQEVESRMKALTKEAKGTAGFWSGMKQELKAFGVMALGFLGFQALVGQIQNVISKNAQLSDSMADVQKTTGLTKNEVQALNVELGKMNTRTPRQELLKLAADAGKLGITGKENILGFVRAADKINVALGEDLGEDALKNIGKLNDLFKVKDSFGYEQGMLKIGSAINSLGQSSTASEAYLVEFTKRMGGISTQANINIQDILGLGATLDSLGQQTETSSTAIGMLLVDMFKSTGDYANIAGMDIKSFTELLNKDANEAFIQVLEGLNGNNEGFAVMTQKLKDVGVEGSRGTAVLSTLAGNVNLLRSQQSLSNEEFQKGTSIMNEFNVKNETFGAQYEKFIKKIYSAFSNSSVTGALQGLLSFANGILDTTPAVDRLTESFNKQKSAVASYEKNMVPLIDRYDELKAKTNPTREEQDELKKVIELISQAIPTAITEFDKYGKAMDINSEKARQFGDNLRNMMEVKNAEALVQTRSDLFDLREEIERTSEALNNRDIEGNLFKTVAITKKVGEEFVTTTEKVKLTGDEIQKLQEKMQSLQDKRIGLELNVNDLTGTQLYKVPDATMNINQNVTTTGDTSSLPAPDTKSLEDFAKKTKELVEQLRDVKIAAIEDEEQRDTAALQAKYDRQKTEVANAVADEKVKSDLLLALKNQFENDSKNLSEKYAQEKNQAALTRDTTDLTAWNETQQLLLLEQFNRGEITEAEHQNKLKELSRQMLEEKKKLAEKYGQDVVAIEKQIQEDIAHDAESALLQEVRRKRAILELNLLQTQEGTEEELQAKIAILNNQMLQEVALTTLTEEEKKVIIQKYLNDIKALKDEAAQQDMQRAQEVLGTMAQGYESLNAIFNNLSEQELRKDREVKNKKKENLKNQLDSGKITEKKYRQEIEKIDAEYAKKEKAEKTKAFERDRLGKTLMAMANVALGVTAALGSAPPPYNFILAGLTAAAGALEIVAIQSTPTPEFKEGLKPTTGIVKGPLHSQQGIRLVDGKTGKVIGEMEGDEGIFSRRMYANNPHLIDAIFEAKGGPVKTEDIVPNPPPVPDLRSVVSKAEQIVMQAGRNISQMLPPDQVAQIKQHTQKMFSATNLREQTEAIKNYRQYTDEVLNIYRDKTQILNELDARQNKVQKTNNVTTTENLESSFNTVTNAITTISDRKLLETQQMEYFKRAAFLISKVDDEVITSSTLQQELNVLEQQLRSRTLSSATQINSLKKDNFFETTTTEISEQNRELQYSLAPKQLQPTAEFNPPAVPAWVNQPVQQ